GAVVSDASGIASYLSLSINLAGSKQLTASSGALPSATSTAFTVSPAAPASLAFTVQPSNVVAGVAIAPAVQAKVADAFGDGGAAPSTTSATFTVSPAAAATLAFVVQPTNAVAGVAVAPAVQVKVGDAFGNGVAGTSVSLALVGTGTLTGGDAASTDAGGIAT